MCTNCQMLIFDLSVLTVKRNWAAIIIAAKKLGHSPNSAHTQVLHGQWIPNGNWCNSYLQTHLLSCFQLHCGFTYCYKKAIGFFQSYYLNNPLNHKNNFQFHVCFIKSRFSWFEVMDSYSKLYRLKSCMQNLKRSTFLVTTTQLC